MARDYLLFLFYKRLSDSLIPVSLLIINGLWLRVIYQFHILRKKAGQKRLTIHRRPSIL